MEDNILPFVERDSHAVLLQVKQRTRRDMQPVIDGIHELLFPDAFDLDLPSKGVPEMMGSMRRVFVSPQAFRSTLDTAWCAFIMDTCSTLCLTAICQQCSCTASFTGFSYVQGHRHCNAYMRAAASEGTHHFGAHVEGDGEGSCFASKGAVGAEDDGAARLAAGSGAMYFGRTCKSCALSVRVAQQSAVRVGMLQAAAAKSFRT